MVVAMEMLGHSKDGDVQRGCEFDDDRDNEVKIAEYCDAERGEKSSVCIEIW